MARVLIVGGGIAGVTAAFRLRQLRPDLDVTVIEQSDRVGGKLRLAEIAGATVDVGAEAMLNRRPEAVALAHDAGLDELLVHPQTISSQLWNRRRLVPLPRTLMGIPGDIGALSDVLSKAGQMRAAMESRLPASTIDGDVSIGHLVEERFGREVVDRLVEPLLGGVYAGHARQISTYAAVPQVAQMLRGERSLTRAAQAALGASSSDVPVFAGLRGGMGQLPEAVAAASGATVLTDTTVRVLARTTTRWRVVTGATTEPELIEAEAVVLATPAAPTARLLSQVAPGAALELGRIDYASSAVVTMAFNKRDFPAVPGSGFLVPPVDGHRIKASTFSHQKWQWVGDLDHVVMRCSVGRYQEEASLQRSDDELVDLAVAELGEAIGLSTRPVDSHVQRWGGGLPQYFVGHLDRVASIRTALDPIAGLAVCGAAYDGLGIPACVASADKAVSKVLGDLETMRP